MFQVTRAAPRIEPAYMTGRCAHRRMHEALDRRTVHLVGLGSDLGSSVIVIELRGSTVLRALTMGLRQRLRREA